MLRAAYALLPLALLAGGAGAARQRSRAAESRVASTAGQAPGDVGAITGPLDVVGTVGENIADAANEVQDAATQASQPVIQDPQSALGGAVGSAESVMQNLVPGRGLVTDVLAKSQVAAPTPAPVSRTTAAPQAYAPAPFNGVYCRGSACQYRPGYRQRFGGRPGPSGAGAGGEAEAGEAGDDLSQQEFCRGLACPPGSGHPPDPSRDQFVERCAQLLAGMPGNDESREVFDVYETVRTVCSLRVDMLEADFCKDYAAVFVAALSPLFNEPTVGDARQVCSSTRTFVSLVKQAEVDLQLFEADPSQGGGGNSSSSIDPNMTALSPSGNVEIVPGSGALRAVRVSGGLFSSCLRQMEAVTKGEARSAAKTVGMAKEWCALQTIITSWDDVQGKEGQVHPEWRAQNCLGITQLMAFALREDMESDSTLPAKKVCKNLFLAAGAIHGADRLVENSLMLVTRGLPPVGLALPTNDPAMRALAQESAERAETVMARLRNEKKAAEALKNAKEQVAAYESQTALVAVSRAVRQRRGARTAAAAAA